MSNARDLFGTGGGGGNYPKIDELEHKLVILKPSKIEYNVEGKYGPQDRVTADVAIFDEQAGTWDDSTTDMYFSQVGIVKPCEKALKPGQKPMVLGVVSKVPSKQTKEMKPPLDTVEKVYEGIKAWREGIAAGKKVVEPKFAWGLIDFTEDQGALAMKYLNASSPFAPGEEQVA